MPQIHITLKSFEWHYIEKNVTFLQSLYLLLNKKKTDSLVEINFPKKVKLFTVLRSPHIDKKSREQFHFKFYTKKLCITCNNIKQAIMLLFLIKNSQFPNVEIHVSFKYKSTFPRIKIQH